MNKTWDCGTIIDGIPEYLLSCRTEGKSLRTITWYEQKLCYFAGFLKLRGLSVALSDIGPREIRHFIAHLQGDILACANNPRRPTQDKPLSPQTIAGYVRTLRAFFSWAVRESQINEHPMRFVKTPKIPVRDMPFFTDDEVQDILSALKQNTPLGQRNYTMALVMLDTGLRVSELLGLRIGDLHLDQSYITVIGKGDKQRNVPLGRKSLAALRNYARRYRPETATEWESQVFLTREGRPLRPDYVYKIISGACRQAGIVRERLGPHTCRHTFARSFLLNGGSLLALQRILGHTSLEVVRLYVSLQTSDLIDQQWRYSPMDTLAARPLQSVGRTSSHGAHS